MADFITEFEFDLPKGYKDDNGVIHRHGVMRLATAADEIVPLRDPRVVGNPAYLTIMLLSRVITKLGDVPVVTTRVIEGLFSADLAYLQNMYQQINAMEEVKETCVCPECGKVFEKSVNFTLAE